MTQSEFDKQWITAIAGRGADKFLMEWKAEAAIRELKRKKQLEAVCGLAFSTKLASWSMA
jgi:hypothetical protein